jgi:hypothetical protein
MATESEYTSGGGNSTPEDAARHKMMRGEDLTSAEWQLIRENSPKKDTAGGKYETYDIPLFQTKTTKTK